MTGIASRLSSAITPIFVGLRLGYGLADKLTLALFLSWSRWTAGAHIRSKAFAIRVEGKKHTVHVRNNFADALILAEAFLHNEYQDYLPGVPLTTIFDVGANVGYIALFLKSRYPDARISCFEPDPDNFKQLVLNTKDVSGVACHQVALGSAPGTATFYQNAHFHMRNSLVPMNEATKIEVKVVTLADAMRDAGIESIDLMKIDVEGGEGDILTPSAPLGKVRTILGELHPALLGDETYQKLLGTLRAHFSLKLDPLGTTVLFHGTRN